MLTKPTVHNVVTTSGMRDLMRDVGAVERSRCIRGLTFDMSGGWRQAKPAGKRPLDGRVRLLHEDEFLSQKPKRREQQAARKYLWRRLAKTRAPLQQALRPAKGRKVCRQQG
jgi:hypothetical protein